jgi:hypothetical protein
MGGVFKRPIMITIYKYQFQIADKVIIEMPAQAQILSVQVQNGMPTLWAKVNTDRQKETRSFFVFGTSHELNPHFEYEHVATIQIHNLVWHIFE